MINDIMIGIIIGGCCALAGVVIARSQELVRRENFHKYQMRQMVEKIDELKAKLKETA